jgi:hypothetical protein
MGYMLLEERLRLKKIKLQKVDEDLTKQKENFLKGMNANKHERFNEHGVSTEASLAITLLEAQNLKPMDLDGSSDPYVVFYLDKQKSTSSFKPNTLDPIWNEDFNFRIDNLDSVLKVECYDKDDVGSDDFEGGISISMSELKTQNKVDQWYDLIVDENTTDNGRIRLRLHLIWNKYKFFEDNYNKTDMQIMRLQEDINELNRLFELFEKPFGIIIYGEIVPILEKRILERSEDITHYMQSSRKTVFASPKNMGRSSIGQRFENVLRGTFSKNYI